MEGSGPRQSKAGPILSIPYRPRVRSAPPGRSAESFDSPAKGQGGLSFKRSHRHSREGGNPGVGACAAGDLRPLAPLIVIIERLCGAPQGLSIITMRGAKSKFPALGNLPNSPSKKGAFLCPFCKGGLRGISHLHQLGSLRLYWPDNENRKTLGRLRALSSPQ